MKSVMYKRWILECLAPVSLLLSSCVTHTYYVEEEEAKRAVRILGHEPMVVVDARDEDENKSVRIRLYQDDEVVIHGAGIQTDMTEELARIDPQSPAIQGFRYQERSWGPILLGMGISSTIVSYLTSTAIALEAEEATYAIPVYGTVRWAADIAESCDGLGCILVPGAIMIAIAMAGSHVVGPIMIFTGSHSSGPSREMEGLPMGDGQDVGYLRLAPSGQPAIGFCLQFSF